MRRVVLALVLLAGCSKPAEQKLVIEVKGTPAQQAIADAAVADARHKAQMFKACNDERERMLEAIEAAEKANNPLDDKAAEAYMLVEAEFAEREKANKWAAYEWMVGKLKGKSLRDFLPAESPPQ